MFRLALTRLVSATSRSVVSRVFTSRQALGQIVSRMGVQFRCKICDHTLHKTFTRQSYEQGVVIIRCDSCENLHLIADNLGWFKDLTENGKFK